MSNMGMWHVANEFLLDFKQESKFNLQKMDSFNSSPTNPKFTPMIGTSSEKTKKNLTELMEMSQQKHTPSKCHLCRFRKILVQMQIPSPKNPTIPQNPTEIAARSVGCRHLGQFLMGPLPFLSVGWSA